MSKPNLQKTVELLNLIYPAAEVLHILGISHTFLNEVLPVTQSFPRIALA